MDWNEGLKKGTPAYDFASSTEKTIRSVAGPGTGKSFAIQRRIVRLMSEGVNPKKILAISFTRTAARDLKNDISSLDVVGSENIKAVTLHSHALGILMREDVIEKTNRTPRMILEHEIKPGLRDLGSQKYGDIKNRKFLCDSYLAAWATLQVDEPGFAQEQQQKDFENDLVNWMTAHSGMLVGEVIPEVVKYLKYNPASSAIGDYDVILVDEYQDLNKAEQQEFVRLIKGEDTEIVIVGDDDQSIYGFKYAHPEGIRSIDELHGDFVDIDFDECRRCPTLVTKIASDLIKNNPNRTLDSLSPFKENPEGDVKIIQWRNYEEEVPGIIKLVRNELEGNKISPNDILILTPRRIIGYKLRDQMLAAGIQVKSYFRESAIKKLSVQRAYSLFNLIAYPDDKIALRFLLGAGVEDFRASQYERLVKIATEKNITVRELLDSIIKGKNEVKNISTIFAEYIKILREMLLIRKVLKDNPSELFSKIYIKNEESETDFYEINEIYQKIISEVDSPDFLNEKDELEWIKNVFSRIRGQITNPEIPEVLDHVRIMSLHSSKGLSSKFVIVCSMIDELIPFLTKKMSDEEKEKHIQEQRRLFYVAITRCKGDSSYHGRLVISSFLNMPSTQALQMSIPAKNNINRTLTATRYLQELGENAPFPERG